MDILLVIRGLAALAVVFWHTSGYQAEIPSIINMPGRTAVWLFFGISGYVISYGFIHRRYSLTTMGFKHFYINRFLRIYPLFIFLSFLSWLTLFLQTGNSPISLKDVPEQLLAFQFDQDYILNGVFWTLGIELHFYLLAPLLVMPLLTDRFKVAIMYGVILYSVVILWNIFAIAKLGWSIDGRNVIANLQHFIIGMVGCRIVADKPHLLQRKLAFFMALILLAITNWLYHNFQIGYWTIGVLAVDVIILLLIFFHASIEKLGLRTSYIYFIFSYIGTLAYGVYAIHGYLLKSFPSIFDTPIILAVSSLCLAYITYRVIERPALRLKRH